MQRRSALIGAAVVVAGILGPSVASAQLRPDFRSTVHTVVLPELIDDFVEDGSWTRNEAALLTPDVVAGHTAGPGDLVAGSAFWVPAVAGALNPVLVPEGVIEHPGSLTRSGFVDEFAIDGNWLVVDFAVVAPEDCANWGIEASVAWTEIGREFAAASPEVVNDPVAGHSGTDSIKLDACSVVAEHALHIDGTWQIFQSLNTATMVHHDGLIDVRFMIPPRTASTITNLRIIGFGINFDTATANPAEIHFETISGPVNVLPVIDLTDPTLDAVTPDAAAFIAGDPVPSAVPLGPIEDVASPPINDVDPATDAGQSTTEEPAPTTLTPETKKNASNVLRNILIATGFGVAGLLGYQIYRKQQIETTDAEHRRQNRRKMLARALELGAKPDEDGLVTIPMQVLVEMNPGYSDDVSLRPDAEDMGEMQAAQASGGSWEGLANLDLIVKLSTNDPDLMMWSDPNEGARSEADDATRAEHHRRLIELIYGTTDDDPVWNEHRGGTPTKGDPEYYEATMETVSDEVALDGDNG